jgi:hypothetical protein
MLRNNRFLIAGIAAIVISPSHAACNYPEEVKIPDGATATTEDMVNAQTLVKQFMADMETYLDCLDQEEATIPEKQTPEAKALHLQRHNEAVDAMEAVAAQFNEQILAYKKANE